MLSIVFEQGSCRNIDTTAAQSELTGHPALDSLFNQAARSVCQELRPSEECLDKSATFAIRGELEGFTLSNQPVREVEFCGRARLIAQEVECPSVKAYGPPEAVTDDRMAMVEQFAFGDTAIVHDDRRVSVVIDISQLKMPPLRQFRFVRLQAADEVEHEAFELVGAEALRVQSGRMAVEFVEDASA